MEYQTAERCGAAKSTVIILMASAPELVITALAMCIKKRRLKKSLDYWGGP